jgi:DNA repair protein RadC
MIISEWPADERPREKLLRHGAEHLSDAELLAIFLRTGCSGLSAVDLARNLLLRFGSLRAIFESSESEFCQTKGLGLAKYCQLQAVLNMATRCMDEKLRRDQTLDSSRSVKHYVMSQLKHKQSEVFAVLFLDSQHRLIIYEELFFGTIDGASVYPREVVKYALKHNAAAVIFAHNHPSGIAEPSPADRHITERLKSALELIDVRTLDHLIIGDADVVSFAERGLL